MRLAPAWYRFVNQFVDVFTCYFLVLGTPIGDFLFSFIFDFNGLEAVVIYVFYIFYCFVFEFLLNATPSKYLTQSRLIAVEPVKLNVSTVLLRTVCRVIPFEAWSFLFAKAGWHDSLSNTRVVKTKPDAVKSGKLFLIIIIVAVASGLPFLINWGSRELIENNHYEKERNARFEELVNRAENLNGKSGLFIKKQDNYRTEFLLVKNIDNNIVEAYLVPHEMGVVERFTQEELVSFINRNDAMLETVRFSLNDLIEVVKDNGQTYHKIEKNSPFRIQNYEVEKIFNFEEPMLNVSSNSTSCGNDEFSRNITI